jgi:hypothetical protein
MSQEKTSYRKSDEDSQDSRETWASLVEKELKERKKRYRVGRSDFDVPELWRSYYYLRQGYYLGVENGNRRGHWQGGPSQHQGAKCSTCKRPLRLIWDINCRDSRFQKESSPVFQGLQQLPLYYCFDCPSPTIYRCTKPNRITVLESEKEPGEESPFEKAPPILSRKPLIFKPIPSQIENLIIISEALGTDWLRNKDKALLRQYFGRLYFLYRRSQFGGIPVLEQGHQEIICPNSRCPTHKWGNNIGRKRQYYCLKELAVIDTDSGFDFETHCAQIVFHFCWACHLVHGKYMID